MPERKPKCDWTVTKMNRVLRCQSAGIKTLTVEGVGILLCAYHYNVVLQMIKRKEHFDRLSKATKDEILRAVDEIEKRKRNEFNAG